MHITKQDYNSIMLNYNDYLKSHEYEFSKLKEKIYNDNPSLLDDEYKLKSLRLKKVKANIQGSDDKVFDKEISLLSNKIDNILKTYNLTKETFETSHACNKCNDTGYIGNKMCNCLKRFVIDYTYKNSHLREQFKIENFDTFNFDYYSNEKIPNMPFSPRDNAKIIHGASKDFCNNFEDILSKDYTEKFNLLFYGMPGLGKTFMCNAIAKKILDKCYSVIYYSACELSKIVISAAFNHGYDSDESINYELDNIYDADLLIIDDLGTEPNNSMFLSEFFNIINVRMKSHRPTIISTNLDMKDLRDKYTERISSRFLEAYEIFKFVGTNIRELKNNK